MRRRIPPVVALALSLVGPAWLAAQAPAAPAPRDGIMQAFEGIADVFGSRLVAAFDSIPAARYDFRPKATQQTIGYIAQHLEGANYALCERLGEMTHPRTPKDALADTVKARWPKDTLVARLRESLRFCDTALARMPVLRSGGEARSLLLFETDLAEHYSQLAVYMRLLDLVPPSALPPPKRTAIELPASALAPYVGVYQLDETLQLYITMEGGALFARSTGGATLRLWPESGSDFFLKERDLRITFTRDTSGAVTGVVVHQFGRDRFVRKIS